MTMSGLSLKSKEKTFAKELGLRLKNVLIVPPWYFSHKCSYCQLGTATGNSQGLSSASSLLEDCIEYS